MKSKTMILMVVAVVCGLAASYMTSRLLAERNEKVFVLVAKAKYSPWTPVKVPEDMFEMEERLKNDIPKNAITKFEGVKDHLLIKGLDKGDPVVSENLLSKDKGGLDVLLPQGKRAMAVRTTAEIVAGGFVLPGSRVDVIHTSKTKGNESHAQSQVILQNILVKAVDQQSNKPEDRPGVVPSTVTLEVTPEQALVLASVRDTGALTLTLRAYGDDHVEDITPAPTTPKAKPEEKKVVVVEAPAEPKKPAIKEAPVDKKTLVIQNGNQWIRATYLTQNGQMNTTIEHSQSDMMPSSSAPPPIGGGKAPGAK